MWKRASQSVVNRPPMLVPMCMCSSVRLQEQWSVLGALHCVVMSLCPNNISLCCHLFISHPAEKVNQTPAPRL